MEKVKCSCGYDGSHKTSLVFFEPDLKLVDSGMKIVPRFSIKCICGDCGKCIKFLPYKNNLRELNNKFIEI